MKARGRLAIVCFVTLTITVILVVNRLLLTNLFTRDQSIKENISSVEGQSSNIEPNSIESRGKAIVESIIQSRSDGHLVVRRSSDFIYRLTLVAHWRVWKNYSKDEQMQVRLHLKNLILFARQNPHLYNTAKNNSADYLILKRQIEELCDQCYEVNVEPPNADWSEITPYLVVIQGDNFYVEDIMPYFKPLYYKQDENPFNKPEKENNYWTDP